MATEPTVEFRYCPRRCKLLDKDVWAIMTQQADGPWRIVNCLDKEEGCFGLACAFTTDHGAWPYTTAASELSPPQGASP